MAERGKTKFTPYKTGALVWLEGLIYTPITHIKTSPKAIQTISHQEGPIRHFIRTRTTAPMENTPSDPHQPPDAL